VPTDANFDSHQSEGRIIAAEFPSCKVISRYVPYNGNSDQKKILKRKADDKLAMEYLTNTAKTSSKVLVYMGDLNVCNNITTCPQAQNSGERKAKEECYQINYRQTRRTAASVAQQ
jgi:exonuclease III